MELGYLLIFKQTRLSVSVGFIDLYYSLMEIECQEFVSCGIRRPSNNAIIPIHHPRMSFSVLVVVLIFFRFKA